MTHDDYTSYSRVKKRIDDSGVFQFQLQTNPSWLGSVDICPYFDFQFTQGTYKRAGVVLIDSRGLFGFGRDYKSGDLTDFGGHPRYTDLDIIHTAHREFTEESQGIIDLNIAADLNRSYVLYSEEMVIVFYKLKNPYSIQKLRDKFFENRKRVRRPEISELVSLTLGEIYDNLNEFYTPVKIHLQKCFYKMLVLLGDEQGS